MPHGGFPTASKWGAESKVAHKWARWLHNPCRLGGPHRFRAGGQNQRWPTSGQGGYITRAVWGVPTATKRGAESMVAHKWARWLYNPCHLGGSLGLQSGGHNHRWPKSGQGGYITPAAWGSPPLQSGGQDQRWPTSGQGGYMTRAAWGVPTASKRGAESQVAHKWARWLHNPCRMGGSPRLQSGGAESEVAHKWAW